jgi:hypothetical protein
MSTFAPKRLAKDWTPPVVHALLRKQFRRYPQWNTLAMSGLAATVVPAVGMTLPSLWYSKRTGPLPRTSAFQRALGLLAMGGRGLGRGGAAQFARRCILHRADCRREAALFRTRLARDIRPLRTDRQSCRPLANIAYHVKDRASICAAGSRLNPEVRFFDTVEAAFARMLMTWCWRATPCIRP